MGKDMDGWKWGLAGGASMLAWWGSARLMTSLHGAARSEWKENESSEVLPIQQVQWQIVHTRDDIAAICGLLTLTNSLLAAILVILAFR
jgi:hypothetical protein